MASNTTIAIRKSATPSAVPSNLANGELAINYADGKIFYKNASNQIVEFTPQVTFPSFFGTVNANNTLIISDTTGDVFSLLPGSGITITGDAINDTITVGSNCILNANGTVIVAGHYGLGGSPYITNDAYAGLTIGGTRHGAFHLKDSSDRLTTHMYTGDNDRYLIAYQTNGELSGLLKFTTPATTDRSVLSAFDQDFDIGTVLSYSSRSGMSFYQNTASNGRISFVTGGLERMYVLNDGNVLIGRTTSTVGQGVKLDIAGAVNASAYYVNGTLLTSGNGGGGASVNVAMIPPSSGNSVGDLWWSTNTGRLFIYYSDTDSSQWVDASPGLIGPTGAAGNVTIGTTTTTAPNTPVSVTNSGNGSYAILNFNIPRNNTVALGTTSTLAPNTPPTVTNGGTASDIVLNFGIPRPNTTTVGTTTVLSPATPATVTNGGTASDIILNFAIPRSNTVRVGNTATLAPNTPPTVTNAGNTSDIVLEFSIPRNNTVTVGTTTTGAPGTAASVTNGGTASDITLNFTIPRGNVGTYNPKSITVVGPQAGDEYTIFYTGPQSLTLANLVAITSSQNVAWANSSVVANVYYGTDRWYPSATQILTLYNSGNSRVGNSTTTFTNSAIPANNYVYMRVHSISNTPAEYHMSLIFN